MYTKLKTYKENILVPRNIESRQEKLKQDAIKLLSQEIINGDFKLQKYMLDIPEDLIKVKVINGDLSCILLNLIELPKWFENLTIKNNFACSKNRLKTLKNCPQTIGGNFTCSYNELTTLEGCPQTIVGNFSCHNNKLITLEGCPQTIGGNFSCHNNKLITLEGCPQTINGNFYCDNNKLITLEGCPQTINGNFYCDNNIVKLQRPDNCDIKGDFFN